jgi:hypothetical protein
VSVAVLVGTGSSTSTLLSNLVGSLLSVEQGRDFLEGKGAVLAQSLDNGEVEVSELEGEPDTVDNVVFPVEGVHGDRVDVLVEDEGTVDTDLEDKETLGSNSVWKTRGSAGQKLESKEVLTFRQCRR